MNFFKKTLYTTMVASALLSCPLAAKAMKAPTPTNVETAAMGGLDLVVNNGLELLTNPALMEYRGTKLSIPALNLKIDDPVGTVDTIMNYKDFFEEFGSLPDEDKLDYAVSFAKSKDRRVLAAGVSLVPSFQLSTSIGTFGIAGYCVNETAGVADTNGLHGLVELNDAIESMDAQSFLGGREFAIDKPLDLFSVADAGAAVGYAKRFGIRDVMDVSAGVSLRFFERAFIDYAPSAKLSVGLDAQDISSIGQGEDLETVLKGKGLDLGSAFNKPPELVTGFGVAMDFGLVLSKKFWVMDAMLGASLKNAPSNAITYSDGSLSMDKLQYGVGLSSHPLLVFPVLNGLLVGAEMHGVEGMQTYHMGLSWKFGDEVSITPKVGFRVGRIDARGNFRDVNMLTAGFALDLVVVDLAASYALDTDGMSQFGLGFDFGYEWVKN